MKKRNLLAAGMLFLALPGTGQAVELIGKKLELYGKAHISLDYSDPDAAGEDSQLSVSNNSSRIGFKGQHAVSDGLSVLWQYEQNVNLDEAGGTFATRNSFLGLKGRFGEIRAGHYDTPSKSLGSAWGMFSDTIGDRRAILGAYSGYGNVLNDRADNAILYSNRFGDLAFHAMYSADPFSEDVSGGLDNNDNDLLSLSLEYRANRLLLGMALEQWSHAPAPAPGALKVDNLRLVASYSLAQWRFGAIYESTDSDDPIYARDAYGINAGYAFAAGLDLRLQYLLAEDHAGQADSGAQKLALGVFSQLDPATEIYAAYTVTDNDANAEYQGIDGGHGDELETGPGGDPWSVSVGLVYKF